MEDINENKTIVQNVTCPICGEHIFNASAISDGMYICVNKVNGRTCDHVQCLCKKCNALRDESKFGKHGDVWECKECGTVCWPYTDRMRAIEKAKELLSMFNSFKNSLRF